MLLPAPPAPRRLRQPQGLWGDPHLRSPRCVHLFPPPFEGTVPYSLALTPFPPLFLFWLMFFLYQYVSNQSPLEVLISSEFLRYFFKSFAQMQKPSVCDIGVSVHASVRLRTHWKTMALVLQGGNPQYLYTCALMTAMSNLPSVRLPAKLWKTLPHLHQY